MQPFDVGCGHFRLIGREDADESRLSSARVVLSKVGGQIARSRGERHENLEFLVSRMAKVVNRVEVQCDSLVDKVLKREAILVLQCIKVRGDIILDGWCTC